MKHLSLNLSHPNIIKIYDCKKGSTLNKRNNSTKTIDYLAIELAENGELFDYIAETGRFSEREARYYFR